MLSISLKKWVPIGGIDHVKTDWELSIDSDFTQVVESKTTEGLDKDLFHSEYNVPVGLVYYVRAKRYFNNDTNTGWLETLEVTSNNDAYSRMMLRDSIEIEQPILYVDINEYKNDSPTFKVKSSSYRANNEEHLYSHWVITDFQDNLLFSKLYDSENLLSIDIQKNINIENRHNLKIMCVHVSSEGIESKPGIYLLNLEEYNFEIITDTSNVSPLLDLEVKISAIDNSRPMLIDRLELINVSTSEVVLNPILVSNKFTIPWYILKIGSVLDIYIYGRDIRGAYNKYVKRLVVSKYMKDNFMPDIKYSKVFTPYEENLELLVPNFVTSEFIVNDNFLTPLKGSDKVHLISNVKNKLTNTGLIAKGMSLLNTNNTYTYLKRFNGYMVLVDTFDTYGKPMFMVYKYNVHSDDFTLIHSVIRYDEVMPLGKTNSILQITPEKFVYIPVGGNKLMEYDIVDNTITELGVVPLANFSNGFMIRISSDKIMISGGDGYKTTLYSIIDNKFEDFISLDNRDFMGTEVKSYELINRDTIILNTTSPDVITKALYFNYNEGVISYIDKLTTGKTDSIFILSSNGGLILGNHNERDLVRDIPEHNNFRVFE